MTEEKELNEKLLKWVFPKAGIYFFDNREVMEFVCEQGTMTIRCFTNSLDACFKWLVPGVMEDLKKIYTSPFITLCSYWYDELVSLNGDSSKLGNEALALCLAIEKLIILHANKTRS